MRSTTPRVRNVLIAACVGSLATLPAASASLAGATSAQPATPVFHVKQILDGTSLHHTYTPVEPTASTESPTPITETEALSNPDDITQLGNALFVGFQNGVGPQGEPSMDGNRDSTVVELSLSGHPMAQWDVEGKTDGLTADPASGVVIATVNEDANSALYAIRPGANGAVTKYAYNEVLPHLGGTDAISIFHGQIYISASAPGTNGAPAPQPTYPAVYSVTLDRSSRVATVIPVFGDEDAATVANLDGQFLQPTTLALTDPDSNEVVPTDAARFAGDFMLTSQGDLEQIYLGQQQPRLYVLSLSQSVDDTAWPTDSNGQLFSTDSGHDTVDVVTGPFSEGQPMAVATPCGANDAPGTCPGPGFPANFLAALNPWNGQVTPVAIRGAAYVPQGGLAFVPARP